MLERLKVAVIGGGLSGLTAAHQLVRMGADVTLFEASGRFGGQVHTEHASGMVVEHGAEAFPRRSPELKALVEELKLGDRVVSQVTSRSLGLKNGRLKPIRSGTAARLLGIQASEKDFGMGVLSFSAGMGELVEALVSYLSGRARLRARSPVSKLKAVRGEFELTALTGSRHQVDAVILAVPPMAASQILGGPAARLALKLGRLPSVSSVTVSLAYPRRAVGFPLGTSGMVVLDQDRLSEGLKACSFSSSKFSGRAPRDRVLVRAFFRPGPGYELGSASRLWIKRAASILGPLLQISAAPTKAWVARWPSALPLPDSRRSPLVHHLATRLRSKGRIELAGSAYHGPGIAGAVGSGRRAARMVI